MTIDTTKFTVFGLTGDSTGINTTKYVAYALLELGAEVGAPAIIPTQGFSYSQILGLPFVPGVVVEYTRVPAGDMQSGSDRRLTAGDMQSGTDVRKAQES
jgi:hypothetical protein